MKKINYYKNQQQAQDIFVKLKQHSDLFCPVMHEINPISHEDHFKVCIETLLSLGYTITSPTNFTYKRYINNPPADY